MKQSGLTISRQADRNNEAPNVEVAFGGFFRLPSRPAVANESGGACPTAARYQTRKGPVVL
ncbi:hypothetical protein GGE07_004874 [Sinorhizobium terangae]|nr:hypothetical protein [Sinorhizobium terangae]